MLFVVPNLLSTATPGRRARKDKMPETDEICDVRPAKSLLPLLVSNSSPPGPHPHPSIHPTLGRQTIPWSL